jgi:hypothetical protein
MLDVSMRPELLERPRAWVNEEAGDDLSHVPLISNDCALEGPPAREDRSAYVPGFEFGVSVQGCHCVRTW